LATSTRSLSLSPNGRRSERLRALLAQGRAAWERSQPAAALALHRATARPRGAYFNIGGRERRNRYPKTVSEKLEKKKKIT
jgi:hypothetical protein